jgi:hypothetical protein
MSETYSTAEVAKHKSDADGFWIIVDDGVYDVTSEFHLPLCQQPSLSSSQITTTIFISP